MRGGGGCSAAAVEMHRHLAASQVRASVEEQRVGLPVGVQHAPEPRPRVNRLLPPPVRLQRTSEQGQARDAEGAVLSTSPAKP